MAEGSEKVVMADPAPLIIAYPPIKRNIKQEIQDEHRVVNTVEEENGTLQVQYSRPFLLIFVVKSVFKT